MSYIAPRYELSAKLLFLSVAEGGRVIARHAFRAAGGKSELHRAGWSLTATGGDPRESATENIPPRASRGKGEKAR